jgi:hypothetical protein
VKSPASLVSGIQAVAVIQHEILLPARRITARAVPGPRHCIRRFPTDCLPGAYIADCKPLCKQKRPRRTAFNRLISRRKIGAGEGIRTLDPNLGKVVLPRCRSTVRVSTIRLAGALNPSRRASGTIPT